MKKIVIFILMIVSFATTTFGSGNDSLKKDTTKAKTQYFASVSLVNRYIWRGTLLDGRPNIQPVLCISRSGIEIGALGSLNSNNSYCEADLYVSYTYKAFKFVVTDFYIDLSGVDNSQNYFNYSDTSCFHTVVCDLIVGGTKKFPLKLTTSTVIYGGLDMDENKNKYTTYVEARYPCKDFEFFVGGLTGQSNFYLNNVNCFGIVNVGAAYNRSIKINSDYSIPIITQLTLNPQMQKFYFTINVTF